jgi:hypothetical protein
LKPENKMRQTRRFRTRTNSTTKPKRDFPVANLEAARIIAPTPARYAGLPLQWAIAILERSGFVTQFQKRKLISTLQFDFATGTNSRRLPVTVNLTVDQQLGFAQPQTSVKTA